MLQLFQILQQLSLQRLKVLENFKVLKKFKDFGGYMNLFDFQKLQKLPDLRLNCSNCLGLWLSLAKDEIVIIIIIGSLTVHCIVLSNIVLMWLLSYCTLCCLHNKIVLSVFRSTAHTLWAVLSDISELRQKI